MPFSLEALRAGRRTGEDCGRQPSFGCKRHGSLVYDTQAYADMPGQAVWVHRQGEVVDSVGAPLEDMINPRISPDGKLISVSAQVG